MMFTTNVPYFYWGEAVLTTTYLINRLPSKPLGFKTPLDLLCQSFPKTVFPNSISPKIFGCVVYVHNHNPSRTKLDPKAIKCIFIRYSPSQKGYKCYCANTRKIFVTLDATFYEDLSFYQSSGHPIVNQSSPSQLLFIDHLLLVCSQGGELPPKNILAQQSQSSSPSSSSSSLMPNATIFSKPMSCSSADNLPPNLRVDDPLLVYSRHP